MSGWAPTVSVVMPLWRARETLGAAIASVQAQDFTDWELIAVDDASDDGSGDMAEALAEHDPRIRVIRQATRGGAARARNAAIEAARGRYIAFLDADDLWLPEKLALQIPFMEETGTALSYAGFWRVSGNRRLCIEVPPRVTYRQLLHGHVIGCVTAVYDTEQVGKVLMPDIRMRHDFALWLDILRQVDCARGLTMPLAVHHRRDGSLSSSLPRRTLATWRMYRDVEGLGRAASARYLLSHLANRAAAVTRARLR